MKRRYEIWYHDHAIWGLLPLDEKEVWNRHKVSYQCEYVRDDEGNILYGHQTTPDDVAMVDAENAALSIALTDEEAAAIYAAGYRISLNPEVAPIPLENEIVTRIDNPGSYYAITPPPYREEYFPGGTCTQDRNYTGWSIDGEITQANFAYLNWTRLHRMGLTGQGVNVCVIDDGMRTDNPGFQDLVFTAVYDQTAVMRHTAQTCSIVAGKRNGVGVYGMAYDSNLYVASFNDPGAAFAWAMLDECKVIVCPFYFFPDAYTERMMKKAIRSGVAIIISAGNSFGYDYINPAGSIRGTIVVGVSQGGDSAEYGDMLALYSWMPKTYQGVTKGIDVVVPVYTTGQDRPDPDKPWIAISSTYFKYGGTSSGGSQVGGLVCSLRQGYDIPGDVMQHLLPKMAKKTAKLTLPDNVNYAYFPLLKI